MKKPVAKKPVENKPTPIRPLDPKELASTAGGVTNGDDWGDASKFT